MEKHSESVQKYYTRSGLGNQILGILKKAGKNIEALTFENIAPVGEFYTRGIEATRELARTVKLGPETHVLDVGCGIGGPARTLANEFGCCVTGIDLTKEFCQVAQMFNERVGIDGEITIHQGNALQLQFDEASFDVIWTQHAQMNIRDKTRMYQEMLRVLKPAGKLTFHDILAGPEQPLHFPVPWAREESFSFLISQSKLRELLLGLGFREICWADKTPETIEWFRVMRERAAKGDGSLLSPGVLLGPEWATMSANMVRNLKENRCTIFQGVFEK